MQDIRIVSYVCPIIAANSTYQVVQLVLVVRVGPVVVPVLAVRAVLAGRLVRVVPSVLEFRVRECLALLAVLGLLGFRVVLVVRHLKRWVVKAHYLTAVAYLLVVLVGRAVRRFLGSLAGLAVHRVLVLRLVRPVLVGRVVRLGRRCIRRSPR